MWGGSEWVSEYDGNTDYGYDGCKALWEMNLWYLGQYIVASGKWDVGCGNGFLSFGPVPPVNV